jgi:hypothetical protein
VSSSCLLEIFYETLCYASHLFNSISYYLLLEDINVQIGQYPNNNLMRIKSPCVFIEVVLLSDMLEDSLYGSIMNAKGEC